MGGACSSAPGSTTPELPHISDKTRVKFDILRIDEDLQRILWTTFCRISKDPTNSKITRNEFHHFYGLEETSFSKMVFSRMDFGHSGTVEFDEYAISVWDFLTLDLNHFVFHLYDKDDSEYLNRDELEDVTLGAFGIRYGKNRAADRVVQRADSNHDGKVTFEEFEEFTKQNQTIAYPGHVLQREMMDRNGGEVLWKQLRQQREQRSGTASLHKLLKKSKSSAT